MKKYSFAWVTAVFFLVSLALHWWFGWNAFVADETAHGAAPQTADYLNEMLRDTFENWQSEFLQLLWQVAGLAYLYYAGSPGSRGDDERMEAKLDAVLRKVGVENADGFIRELDEKYPGRRQTEEALRP